MSIQLFCDHSCARLGNMILREPEHEMLNFALMVSMCNSTDPGSWAAPRGTGCSPLYILWNTVPSCIPVPFCVLAKRAMDAAFQRRCRIQKMLSRIKRGGERAGGETELSLLSISNKAKLFSWDQRQTVEVLQANLPTALEMLWKRGR